MRDCYAKSQFERSRDVTRIKEVRKAHSDLRLGERGKRGWQAKRSARIR
jgi:hypothetical protein